MANKNQRSGTGDAQLSNRAARREAAQAELRRVQAQQRRTRLIWTAVVVAIVVIIFGSVAVYGLNRSGGSGQKTTAATAKLEKTIASIPSGTYDAVGKGDQATQLKTLSGATAMTEGGKPRILYVGAEYCPYCAAERWAVAAALARFGTFSNLGQTTSSKVDVYPDTSTLSFHGATYTSKYIAFKAYETYTNQVQGSSYKPLDTLSTPDGKIFDKYDYPPYVSSKGAIPFIDFGGSYVSQGATYSPQLLAGLTHQQIATALTDPSTTIAKGAIGSANVFTAAICKLTKDQPSSVCSSKAVTAVASAVPQ